jgi:hypothetical protein
MTNQEYKRLSALPFSEIADEEFDALAAEARRENRKYRFVYNPREFEGPRYWERGFLSCVISGAKIPSGITLNLFKIPRNRIVFDVLQKLEKLNLAGIEALTVFLRETGRLEAAGGEGYLSGIKQMVSNPAAVRGFALGLLRLNLGAPI